MFQKVLSQWAQTLKQRRLNADSVLTLFQRRVPIEVGVIVLYLLAKSIVFFSFFFYIT